MIIIPTEDNSTKIEQRKQAMERILARHNSIPSNHWTDKELDDIRIRMLMKRYLFFISVLISAIITGCSSDRQNKAGLAFIDVMKSYAEKEIILTDIADVTYVHLNNDNDEYLYQGSINSITKNTLIVYDNTSGNILFFSKDGKPKSRLNRKGQGLDEYINVRQIIYDESADDVYVLSFGNDEIILIYSSTGEYKRRIILPKGTYINPFLSFDDESLIIYNSRADLKRRTLDESTLPSDFFYVPFVHVSKKDGKVLNLIELHDNKIILRDERIIQGRNGVTGRTSRLIKSTEGILLCMPETDTVFLYGKDKSLTPIIYKTPLVSSSDPMIYMNNCVDIGRYQFMEVFTVRWEEGSYPFPVKYFMRDKKTGEIFRQKIILPDYKGKDFIISPLQSGIDYENGPWFELDLIELKQAYDENRLSGKLKELVATLNEFEDNNVFMIVNFK